MALRGPGVPAAALPRPCLTYDLCRFSFVLTVKGGGGKGMRVVMKAEDFDESLELARVGWP